ncbi:MAG: hypothetical protein ACREMF_09305 [Gemmatimonadales bacterium]
MIHDPRFAVVSATLGVVMLAACESASSPEPLDVRLSVADVWSGGEATLVSAAFAPPSGLPLVRLAGDTLVVRRVDDSTVAAGLPDGNGPYALEVLAPGFAPSTAQVILHGFLSSEDGPVLSGFLQPIPGQPWVLGAGDPGLVEVNVRTGAVLRQWPDTVHSPDCTWGVGPSVRAGHYVLFGKAAGGGCSHPWVWQYGAQLVRLDSLSAAEDVWAVAEVGPGGAISGADDHLFISHCDSAGCTNQPYYYLGGSLTGTTIAPVARRAVLHHWNRLVVNAQTGDTLYRLRLPSQGYRIEGAAFSAAEDTVYAVGSEGVPESHLVMALSATGTLLDTLALPGVAAMDVARDPTRSWIYVAALEGGNVTLVVPQLIVLEQGTLAPVAVLRAPATAALSLTRWHQFRIVPAADAVFVVATAQLYDLHGLRAKILRFSLIP